MTKNLEHPYCCDDFAKKTNEFPDDRDDEELKQNEDGSWYVSYDGDYAALDNVIYCPFCGTRCDAKGVEKAFITSSYSEKYFRHPDGSPVRWRDLAKDSVYYINNDNTLELSDERSRGKGPRIRPRPDPRVGQIKESTYESDFGTWEFVEGPDFSVELKMVRPPYGEDEDDGA